MTRAVLSGLAVVLLVLAGCDASSLGVSADEAAAAVEAAQAFHERDAALDETARGRGRQFAARFDRPHVERRGDTLFVSVQAGWAQALDVEVGGLWVDRRAVFGVMRDEVVSVGIAEYVSEQEITPGARLPLWEPPEGSATLWYKEDYSYQYATGGDGAQFAWSTDGATARAEARMGTTCVVQWWHDADTGELVAYQVLYCYQTGGGDGGCRPDALTCGGGGGGGGGGLPDPGDPDPCNTGDPRLDDPEVHGLFSYLWDQSNADDPLLTNRRETAAFLVPDGVGGWIMQPVTQYSRRAWDRAEFGVPSTLPAGTVIVHTHPIAPREHRALWDEFGMRVDYVAQPSGADKAMLAQTGLAEGLILDGGGPRFYNASGTVTSDHGRCAY